MPDRYLDRPVPPVCSASGDARALDFTRDGFAVRPGPECFADDYEDYDLDEEEREAEAIADLFGFGRRPTMEG